MNYVPKLNLQVMLKSLATVILLNAVAMCQVLSAPASMSDVDVGKTGVQGSSTQSSDKLEIKGAGMDIWYGADGFHFVYVPWDGDGEIVVRVTGIERTDPWAKADVMMRADSTQGSAHAMIASSPEYYTLKSIFKILLCVFN